MTQLRIIEKAIRYKLETLKYDVYYDDSSSSIFVTKLICSQCRIKWNTKYNQCLLCGSINYQLRRCSNFNCNTWYSITGTQSSCHICNSDTLIKSCINPNCISNADEEVFNELFHFSYPEPEIINGKPAKQKVTNEGLMDDPSPFNFSQTWCTKCGSLKNEYKAIKLKILFYNSFGEIDIKSIDKNSDIFILYIDDVKKFITINQQDLESSSLDKHQLNTINSELINQVLSI
jgi:hypothetical protein